MEKTENQTLLWGLTADELYEIIQKQMNYGRKAASYFNFFVQENRILVFKASFEKKEDTQRKTTIFEIKNIEQLQQSDWKEFMKIEIEFVRNCVYAEKNHAVLVTAVGKAYALNLKGKTYEYSPEASAVGNTPETIAFDVTENKFILTFKSKEGTHTRKIKYPKETQ